jgi:hypothetical protein
VAVLASSASARPLRSATPPHLKSMPRESFLFAHRLNQSG